MTAALMHSSYMYVDISVFSRPENCPSVSDVVLISGGSKKERKVKERKRKVRHKKSQNHYILCIYRESPSQQILQHSLQPNFAH